jgi:hypothetical protein
MMGFKIVGATAVGALGRRKDVTRVSNKLSSKIELTGELLQLCGQIWRHAQQLICVLTNRWLSGMWMSCRRTTHARIPAFREGTSFCTFRIILSYKCCKNTVSVHIGYKSMDVLN